MHGHVGTAVGEGVEEDRLAGGLGHTGFLSKSRNVTIDAIAATPSPTTVYTRRLLRAQHHFERRLDST